MTNPFDDDAETPAQYLKLVPMPDRPDPPPNGKGKAKAKSQPEWKEGWQVSETGSPLCNVFNTLICLRCHPRLIGVLGYDEMLETITVTKEIPNRKTLGGEMPRPLTELDVTAIQEEVQRTGLRQVGQQTVQLAVAAVADTAAYHPVRAYLDNLEWDGEPRINGWLGRYMGVEGCAYADQIGAMFLISMVARIFDPGCKSDHMLILEGKQGILKSQACAALAGDWYSDGLPDLKGGDAVRLSMHLRGKWLIEVAELSSFSAAEATHLKRFLTQQVERFTPKYGRIEVTEPRRCTFVGTTNEHKYLKDNTGGRRFWPVVVTWVDLPGLRAARDQLFAEAVVRYRAGDHWWPDAAFEAEFIKPEQAQRAEIDPWEERIKTWLAGGPEVDRDGHPVMAFGFQATRERVDETTCSTVLQQALFMEVGRQSQKEANRVGQLLVALGWVQRRTNKAKTYVRPELSV